MRKILAPALFAAAALLVGVLVLNLHNGRQFSVNLKGPGIPPSISGTTLAAAGSISTSAVTQKPRFTGRDHEGNMWEITAASATQSGTVSTTQIILNMLDAKWQDPSETITLQAKEGTYEEETGWLALAGDVVLTGQGAQLSTPAARANLRTREAEGTQGVTLQGARGGWNLHLTADSFATQAGAESVTFRGHVHAVLTPTRVK